MKILSHLVFCTYIIVLGQILNIFRNVFLNLLFHQSLKNQLPDVLFWEFYTRSAYVISHCIKNNFNTFLSISNQ